MVPYYGALQSWADQGISADYYTDFTQLPNKKLDMSNALHWFITQALSGAKSCYYQNFKDGGGKEIVDETAADCSSCKL